MTFAPKNCLVLLACLFTIKSSAQSPVISKSTNGNLIYQWSKTIENNQSSHTVQILYKNDQTIYKEIVDTITLHQLSEIKEFSACLEKTIESLSDAKANAYFEKPTYTLFKFDKGVIGVFVSISNPSGSIVASSTKEQAIEFLNWLKKIN
jgi:hypothetical protein